MIVEISLEELLVVNAVHYVRDIYNVSVTIDNTKLLLPVLKGPLNNKPRYYESAYFKNGERHSGTYMLVNRKTLHKYIGHSINAYERITGHKCFIRQQKHPSRTMGIIVKDCSIEDWDLMILFTKDEIEALRVEQILLDIYIGDPLTQNIASDANNPFLNMTEETLAILSAKASSPERVLRAIGALEATRANPELIAKTKANQLAILGKKVMAYKIIYPSIEHARKALGLSRELLFILLDNPQFKEVYRINASDEVTVSINETMTEEMQSLWKSDRLEMHTLAGSNMRVIINDAEYESLASAAAGEKIDKNSIRKWALNSEPDENGVRHLKVPEDFRPRGKYKPRKQIPIIETVAT